MTGLLTRFGSESFLAAGVLDAGRGRPDRDLRTLIARQRMREVEHAGRAEPYAGGRWIVGLAAPFGPVSARGPSAEDGVWRRTRFGRTTFTHSLRRARNGSEPVALQLAHDEFRTLGLTTDDGGEFFFVDQTDAGLVVVIDTHTARGQLVARFLRTCPHVRQLSAGYFGRSYADRELGDGTVCRDVYTAQLIEISIVPAGAFGETWIG